MPPRPQFDLPRQVLAAPSSTVLPTAPFIDPVSPPLPCSLTLRVDSPCAAPTRSCLHDAMGHAIQIDDIATDRRGGRITLLLHTDPGHLDLLMHTIMTCLPEAEFGPIGNVNVRVH